MTKVPKAKVCGLYRVCRVQGLGGDWMQCDMHVLSQVDKRIPSEPDHPPGGKEMWSCAMVYKHKYNLYGQEHLAAASGSKA